MREQRLEVGVPFEGAEILYLAIRVDLLRLEEVGPKLLRLVIFGVFRLKVECLESDRQFVVFLLGISFDHLI